MSKKVVIVILVLIILGVYAWYNVPVVKIYSGFNYSRRTMDQYFKWRAEQKRCRIEKCATPVVLD